MGDFLITNHHDRELLRAILAKNKYCYSVLFRCRSKIHNQQKDMFDYRKGEPSTEFLTILRVLSVNNLFDTVSLKMN